MGWSFTRGADKAGVIKKILSDMTSENDKGKWAVIDHSLIGQHLWYVIDWTNKTVNPPKTERIISLSLLQGDKTYGWGHKDMSESCGPCYYDCPLKYLDMAPIPDSQYAQGWRDKVRAYHTNKYAKAKTVKSVEVGDTVKLTPGCRYRGNAITEGMVYMKLGTKVILDWGGIRVRIPPRMIAEVVKGTKAPANTNMEVVVA
jgi:hypothetical protein